MKNILHRRSVRKYTDQDIPMDLVMDVLRTATKAPSWKNSQGWHVIVVQDQERRQALVDTIPEENPAQLSLLQAPIVLVVIADPTVSGAYDDKDYYLVDGGILFAHIMLSATEHKLGTCFVGVFDEDKVKEICQVKEGYKVIGMTPLGIAAYQPKATPRKPLAEVVSLEAQGFGQGIK